MNKQNYEWTENERSICKSAVRTENWIILRNFK